MAINFLDAETTTLSKGLMKNVSTDGSESTLRGLTDITTSKDISGVELRMLAPLIKANNTPKVWPFPGFARLYALTIVISDVTNQLVGNIDLKGFPRIGDQEHLPINKTIFYYQMGETTGTVAPSQIHVLTTVIKSKQDLRDASKILGDVKNDSDYKSLVGTLKDIAKGATNFSPVTDIIVEVAGIVGKYLGKVEDKALGTVINSYTTLYGDFDKLGINKLTYPTRNVDFNFELIVRDKSAPKAQQADVEERSLPEVSIDEAEKVEVDMQPL
ncbi:hypothetical protein [Flavihumibacter solisilvae]|uniref:Uncharacterized protein n=1 Tax=Flavihumibacter solisilvae TaxID=1349421 RepID=A0A0C1IZA8_9BACT|nr:hypothetical protein [Flavihumibacter solisilvae]KIC95834.1 hypothetical protein OI18_04160 [Flavihumibacter solisilvae]